MKKPQALLYMYKILAKGGVLNKKELANKLEVSTKTVERYIEEINLSLQEDLETDFLDVAVKYNKKLNGYVLKSMEKLYISKEDILTISKILLESRGLCNSQMNFLLDKLVANCCNNDESFIKKIIYSEKANYEEPRHGDDKLIEKIWDLSEAARENKKIIIDYTKIGPNGKVNEVSTKRKVIPQGIMFSEYYFYLIAYIDWEDSFKPMGTIPYRLDRIKDYIITEERFDINEIPKLEEGEIRKNSQFMYLGNKEHVEFLYTGRSLEAVEDKLPKAKITTLKDGQYLVKTEGSTRGLKFWILSHGEAIEVLKSKAFREEIIDTVNKLSQIYGGDK
ncbi:helix-turn-helix transcriptional regulator [Clostridium sp. DL1XJH146]